MPEIQGKAGLGNIKEEADRVQSALLKSAYEHHTLTLVAPASDASLTSLAAGAFAGVVRAHTVIIRTSADISVKFNANTNHAVPVSAAEGGFTTNTLEVSQIYITAPAGAVIKFLLV